MTKRSGYCQTSLTCLMNSTLLGTYTISVQYTMVVQIVLPYTPIFNCTLWVVLIIYTGLHWLAYTYFLYIMHLYKHHLACATRYDEWCNIKAYFIYTAQYCIVAQLVLYSTLLLCIYMYIEHTCTIHVGVQYFSVPLYYYPVSQFLAIKPSLWNAKLCTLGGNGSLSSLAN